jgi:transposase
LEKKNTAPQTANQESHVAVFKGRIAALEATQTSLKRACERVNWPMRSYAPLPGFPKPVILVNQHTLNVLSVQNILVRNSGKRFGVKQIHNLTQTELEALLPDAYQILAVSSSLQLMEYLSQRITTLEQAVRKHRKHTPAYEQLLRVNGIGEILAQTIVLETSPIGRFAGVGNYALYCRCVRSTKRSNGKRKG